jgi:hypothetical protein
MSGDRAGQFTGPPRPIRSSAEVWFRCCPTVLRKWGITTTCMNHMRCRWWRGTCSKSTGTNYSQNFTSDWANLGRFLHGLQIAECLQQFELPIWNFAYWENRKKTLEPVCEELQLLEVIGVALAWRILHEQSLYPYHIQRVQAFTPPENRAREVFCQWLLTKCVVNTQFVANILYTGQVGITRDAIVNFYSTHV